MMKTLRRSLVLFGNLLVHGGVDIDPYKDVDNKFFEVSRSHGSPHVRELAYLAHRVWDALKRGHFATAASAARTFISKADMLIGGIYVELPQAATNDGVGGLPSGVYRYGHLYLTPKGTVALTVGDGEGHYAHTAYGWPTLQEALKDLEPVRILNDLPGFYLED